MLMHQNQPSPKQLEQVYGVMGSKDVHEAKKRLSDWFMAVNAADIGEFTECARTYADWMEEILNIFRTGLSNGYTEGCNNRIKVIKRNAYGMRNFERLRKRILHCMSS